MSLLPEHKKTPEEIAHLRDKLGIPPTQESDRDAPAAQPLAKLKPDTMPALHEPIPIPPPPATDIDPISGLPAHRHSEEDLTALRRRGMLETQNEALRLPVRRARTVWVVAGYMLGAFATIPIYQEMPIILPIAMAAAALAFAAFLFFLRPYSRHHGAFISVMVLFVLIYAALQYFPQLRHAT